MNPIFWLLVAWVLFFILIVRMVRHYDKKDHPERYENNDPWDW